MNRPLRISIYMLLTVFIALTMMLPTVATMKPSSPLQSSSCPSISFNSPINVKGGDSIENIAVGDFNEDKHLDLAIRVFKLPGVFNIDVFLGDGKGNFTFSKNIPVMNNPETIFVGDFNKDGHLDTGTATSHNIFIFTGDGLGNFQPINSFTGSTGSTVGGGYSRSVVDLNKDGNLDLVIKGGSLRVFLGDGLGQFTSKDPLTTVGSNEPISVGDFNNDGKLDIVATGLFLGDGLGNFSLFNQAGGVAGDFNKDNNLDLASGFGVNNITIVLGDGTGRFRDSQVLDIGKFLITTSLVEDFNKDGNLDLVVAGGKIDGSGSNGITVFPGDGAGKFCNGITFLGDKVLTKALAVGDFNEDSRPDLVVADFVLGSLSVLLNKPVEPPPPPMDFSLSFNPSTINLARGQSTVFTVTINRTSNFAGNVTVIAPDAKPIKAKLTPSSQSTTGTSLNFSIKIKKAATVGNKQLLFTGRDDTGRVRTSTLTLTIR